MGQMGSEAGLSDARQGSGTYPMIGTQSVPVLQVSNGLLKTADILYSLPRPARHHVFQPALQLVL